jgi:hypothetical protein
MRNLLLAALLLAGCARHSTDALPAKEAKQLLENRSWVDRLPKNRDEKLHVFRFTPAMGGGVYQDRTLFAGSFELFTYEQDGSRIRFNLWHTGDKKISSFTIEQMAKPGPEGVDLKLTISDSPRGPKTYYSWRRATELDSVLAQQPH